MPENKCIHDCGRCTGPDGNLYVKCSAIDGEKIDELCTEYCVDYETEEDDDI